MSETLDEESLQQIYTWIDNIPLSRPKKNITRDFSDGVLIAEIVHHFIPKMVDLHNYSNANSSTQKMDNWNLLSRKCFNKISYNISEEHVVGVVSCTPGIIEFILRDLRQHIDQYLARRKAASMMEKNQIHDELSTSDGSSEISDSQSHVYDPHMHRNYGNYAYVAYQDPYAQSHQVIQGITNANGTIHPQYHFQSQPHMIQDIQAKQQAVPVEPLSPRHEGKSTRKPVTQATKVKMKQPVKPPVNNDAAGLRMALEEKEQTLLASQETVQILQAKIRRLEHLLHLKDLRINELRGHTSDPSTVNHFSPQKPPILNSQPRHVLPNGQSFPIPLTHGGFPPHPPLPQINPIMRPPGVDDQRKY